MESHTNLCPCGCVSVWLDSPDVIMESRTNLCPCGCVSVWLDSPDVIMESHTNLCPCGCVSVWLDSPDVGKLQGPRRHRAGTSGQGRQPQCQSRCECAVHSF